MSAARREAMPAWDKNLFKRISAVASLPAEMRSVSLDSRFGLSLSVRGTGSFRKEAPRGASPRMRRGGASSRGDTFGGAARFTPLPPEGGRSSLRGAALRGASPLILLPSSGGRASFRGASLLGFEKRGSGTSDSFADFFSRGAFFGFLNFSNGSFGGPVAAFFFAADGRFFLAATDALCFSNAAFNVDLPEPSREGRDDGDLREGVLAIWQR